MRFDIISAVPDLVTSPFEHSILKRAADKKLVEIVIHDLREFGLGGYKQIDDYQYGGGAGMVMMIEPIFKCVENLRSQREYDDIIYLTPDGELYDQPMANSLSLKQNLILLCGHYKGVDQRIRDHLISREISIGSYVLSGGELAAAILVDSICRLLPGVLGDETSALFDSFQDGLLAPPVYTRPEVYMGWKVPEILLSGHDARIEDWRHQMSVERTKAIRPELLEDE